MLASATAFRDESSRWRIGPSDVAPHHKGLAMWPSQQGSKSEEEMVSDDIIVSSEHARSVNQQREKYISYEINCETYAGQPQQNRAMHKRIRRLSKQGYTG